jgi:hypothetical protein
MLVQKGKLPCAIFPPQWNDVVRNAHVLVQEGNYHALSFLYSGMMLFEMHLFLCKQES